MIFKIVTDLCGDQVGPYFEGRGDAENYRDAEIDQDEDGETGVDIVECKPKTKLPENLFEAYEWTKAAGELAELANAEGAELTEYVGASVANYCAHNVACDGHAGTGLTTHDLIRLRDWLRS